MSKEDVRKVIENAKPMPKPARDPNQPLTLADAPTFDEAYGAAELMKDRDRELVSLARLPGPGGANWGWGETLDNLLGGGLHPGYMLTLGAASAGAGKTAFIMQLADGLALRTSEVVQQDLQQPLTPVVVLSEMGVPALSWRTLARWTDHDARIFRAGKSAHKVVPGITPEDMDSAFNAARTALTDSPLGPSRRFLREVPATAVGSGPKAVENIYGVVREWREALKPHGKEVWPVVVLDPIQRWQVHTTNEVEALNELVERLHAAAQENGWLLMVTSDTTKAAATAFEGMKKRDPREVATAAFRGTYKLFHDSDAALFLDQGPYDSDGALTRCVLIPKNRWGDHLPSKKAISAFRWIPTRSRYVALAGKDENSTIKEFWSGAPKDSTPSRKRSKQAMPKDDVLDGIAESDEL